MSSTGYHGSYLSWKAVQIVLPWQLSVMERVWVVDQGQLRMGQYNRHYLARVVWHYCDTKDHALLCTGACRELEGPSRLHTCCTGEGEARVLAEDVPYLNMGRRNRLPRAAGS